MKPARSIVVLIFTCLLLNAAQTAAGQAVEEDKTAEAMKLLAGMKAGELPVWDASVALERLGPEVAPMVEEQVGTLKPEYRIGAARALCRIGSVFKGVKALSAIISDDPNSRLALDAAELLGKYGRSQAEGDLVRLLDQVGEPSLRIALARSLWSAATTEQTWEKASTTLHALFKESTGELHKECALALAEINEFSDAVVEILENLQAEPGHRGGQAQALLDLRKLREMNRHSLRIDNTFKDTILREIAMRLRTFHVEESQSFEQLRDAAARGMAGSLDPFTNYYDNEEYKEFRQNMSGQYAGIGAKVGFLGDIDDPDARVFSVIRPIYSGPAYRAEGPGGDGLRSYDEIVKINGEPTRGKELKDLVETLKGPPGTTVRVTIRRRSIEGEKEFEITRENISLNSAFHSMLPGKIGYVRLLHFGNDAVKEFRDAITDLEDDGMQALIIDLRGNPGGLLSAAVDIADMFLKDNKLIVRSVGRDERIVPEERHLTSDPATHPDYPLVVLVNGSSASASEIVAGALQDYNRAVLVGERTYGKGSVQRLMELESDGRQSALKVTIAKYYLPSGRSIQRTHTDRGGVKPDIEIEQEARLDSRDTGKFEEIRQAGSFDDYTEKYLPTHRELLAELAEYDGTDTMRYPGFDEWYDNLTVPISKEAARLLLRAWIRIKLGDERGQEYFLDLQDDDQLDRSIVEAMIKLGRRDDLKNIEHYKGLLKRFKLEK